MFSAAKASIDQARKYIETARALTGFSKSAKAEYLKLAEQQILMAELYIK